MARSIKSPLASRNARLELTPRDKPYHFTEIAKGIALGYRRFAGDNANGRWVARKSDGKGGNGVKALPGCADDYAAADGTKVFDFDQAADLARKFFRGDNENTAAVSRGMPITNRAALLAYKAELEGGAGDPTNATRVLHHLPPMLGDMPVQHTTKADYRAFRVGLAAKLAPASIKRTCVAFAAALEQAAKLDDRITNRTAWKVGFEGIKIDEAADTQNHAPDGKIIELVAGVYARDENLGLFTEAAAQTGARPVQIGRLKVSALQFDPPRLMMQASRKGKKSQTAATPVPITLDLATRLRAHCAGRKPTESLMVQRDGTSWIRSETKRNMPEMTDKYREPFKAVCAEIGLPPEFGFYGLRHSSIIRQLLKGVPTSIVAKAHDTSVKIIEKHYGSYILNFSDEIVRGALLDTAMRDNVVPIRA